MEFLYKNNKKTKIIWKKIKNTTIIEYSYVDNEIIKISYDADSNIISKTIVKVDSMRNPVEQVFYTMIDNDLKVSGRVTYKIKYFN